MTQPEKRVKDRIKLALTNMARRVWQYMPVQMGMGQHGIPDHISCVPVTITPEMVGRTVGVFAAVEAKTEKGKLSQYQKRQLAAIKDAGGFAMVVYGSDEANRVQEEFEAWLRRK